MESSTNNTGLPIGSIAVYAGDLSQSANITALNSAGWLLCDGSSYSTDGYLDLFAAIGTANGGGTGSFNVPDLRGRFLRGTLDAGSVDPDADLRVAAAPGGITGNSTGSLQLSATGQPANLWSIVTGGDHSHSLNLSTGTHDAYKGTGLSIARGFQSSETTSDGQHFHTLTGFDSSTVPINMSLYFIIKAFDLGTPSGIIPAGTITAFGGALSQIYTQWLSCNGANFPLKQYPDLTATMTNNFGGDNQSIIYTPDLRGYFLRGSSHGTDRDPDATSRKPLNAGGNSGDNIGSVQSYATSSPKALSTTIDGDHTHNIGYVAQDHNDVAVGSLYNSCIEWANAAELSTSDGAHTHTLTGGDNETRPVNVYAEFLVANSTITATTPPVGTIMSFGGDITNYAILQQLAADGWLACNGAYVNNSTYVDLYDVIGQTYGGTSTAFAVPDLRGYFITGVQANVTVGTIQHSSTTGAPVTNFTTSTDGDHTHTFDNIPAGSFTSDRVGGKDMSEYNSGQNPTSEDGAHAHTLTGGDAESRPVNVNVDFIIRFK
jgi:microcystin-dependent protein